MASPLHGLLTPLSCTLECQCGSVLRLTEKTASEAREANWVKIHSGPGCGHFRVVISAVPKPPHG